MKQLQALVESRELAPIDAELAALLMRRATSALGSIDEARVVAMTGALLSAERGRGHSCLDLRALAGRTPWESASALRLPSVDAWRSILERSRVCHDGSSVAPLVLDGDRLYLHRFHAAERRLASAVRERVKPERAAAPDASTVHLFRTLFPTTEGETDWQAVAAAVALRGRLTVVTGGPGTGKTTTVARILALLLEREPTLRVALAAPTGKAAARLAESIADGAAKMRIDAVLRDRLPREGRTLHRLLDYRPWNDSFGHGPDAPLAEGVIVVDEASMVDVLLMDALFAAARPSARIILLGDQDQLASVETGYVLGDVCRAAEEGASRHGPEMARWYAALSGSALDADARATPLRDAVVRLQRSYRFEKQPGIGAVAEAVRGGDADGALDALADERHAEVRRRDGARSAEELLAPLTPLIDAYLDARDPAAALVHYGAIRLLCALRDGRTGVTGLVDLVERWLRGRGLFTRARWYDRKPVLVTANDASTGLFNGDVGITWVDGGRAVVCFSDGSGGVRTVSPARLPAHETAWAMTVHKSQGSEFDHVLLVLPDEDHRVLTRELLYTGVTRARRTVDVVGSEAVVRAAVARTTTRASGLVGRLLG